MSEPPERIKAALEIAYQSGQTDGADHKMWVIDQMVRALTGCPVVRKQAKDYQSRAYEYEAQGESQEYQQWVRDYETGQDVDDVYDWDTGIAP